METDGDIALPPLREDLRIEAAAPLASGAPVWVIYDPARHRYFQIGRRSVEMLSAWTTGMASALRSRLTDEKGWTPGEAELANLIRFLFANELTAAPMDGRSAAYAAKGAAGRRGALLGLAKAYLFFRVPLLRPEQALKAAAPWVRPLFTRSFALFAVVCAALGLGLASRQLDAFLAYAERSVSAEGAAYYAAALILVKAIHELGHAFQATLRGVRVASMGVAFMVMMPLLYTDVSDAWRTRNRRDKLMIDAGGVLAELAVAAIATLIWVFLPDGPARMAVFAIATASWVLSLVVNLNPFMRFDGYYFLGDAIGLQNLQPRAFAMCRWRLREFLFGLGRAPPERVGAGRRRFMVAYGMGTWIYRLFLFLGIALIVYNLFFKALGLLLFAIEIVFFIAAPIAKEIGVWIKDRAAILRSPRTYLTTLIVGSLFAFAVIPQPVRVTAPAVLSFEREAAIYPPAAGRLRDVDLAKGDEVAAGQALAVIAAPEISHQIEAAMLRAELLELRLARSAADARERGEALVFQRELDGERARLAGLMERLDRLTLRAPFAGVVADMDRRAAPGVWLSREARLALVVDPAAVDVRGFVAESDLERIALGVEGVFVPDDPAAAPRQGRITRIDGFAVDRLDPGYLASTNGGAIDVAAADPGGPPRPVASWYAIRFALGDAAAPSGVPQVRRGVVIAHGRRESWASRFFSQIARILVREFGA